MLTVINTTTMEVIAAVSSVRLDMVLAWAETVPYQNDFVVIAHIPDNLKPFSTKELKALCRNMVPHGLPPRSFDRATVVARTIELLNEIPMTSDMPPDEKRVAPIPNMNEETTMATRKKTATRKAPARKTPPIKAPAKKKTATRKAPAKKKVAAKKTAVAVKRESKNGVLTPKDGTVTDKIFGIADKMSKKAGGAAKRADVIEACVKAGVKPGSATAGYQHWRRYNGLCKDS